MDIKVYITATLKILLIDIRITIFIYEFTFKWAGVE